MLWLLLSMLRSISPNPEPPDPVALNPDLALLPKPPPPLLLLLLLRQDLQNRAVALLLLPLLGCNGTLLLLPMPPVHVAAAAAVIVGMWLVTVLLSVQLAPVAWLLPLAVGMPA
jgi:hypothetical protein